MKNKISPFGLLGLSVLNLVACAKPSLTTGQSSISDRELHQIEMVINADYGFHIEDKVTLLLDTTLIFFNPLDYDVDGFIAGDYVTIKYFGEWNLQETYPSTIDISKLELYNVSVSRGELYEFEVISNGEGNILKVLNDETVGEFLTSHVINENGSFQNYATYPIGTKIYGINPAHLETKDIFAFYSYVPFVQIFAD
ncbi:MAG: hypothetical protein ACOX3K_01640 [Bacilli bacterium]|jgi:hypothetical protein